jgi:membrane-bound lytic murein transglycosylase A
MALSGPRFRPSVLLLSGLLVILALGWLNCFPEGRRAGRTPRTAMWIVAPEDWPSFDDDLDRASLIRAIDMSLKYLTEIRRSRRPFIFGPMVVSHAQMKAGLTRLRRIVERVRDRRQFMTLLKRHFVLLQAAGQSGVGDMFVTGYYEPILDGSLKPDETYKYALYRKPDDMVRIELYKFRPGYRGVILTGRVTEDKRVVPYYDRQQIEDKGALQGKGLEIVWVKSHINVFFLHIQGSGQVRLPDGKRIRVNYHAANGQPYRSIGSLLVREGWIKSDEISMQRIKQFLIDHPKQQKRVMNYNPAYVFFRVVEEGPLGSLQVPLTAGRSVATDYRLFPRGAVGLLFSWRPRVDFQGKILDWRPLQRLVVNQDTGGAIRGAGRLDYFAGCGPMAELTAGYLRHPGKLYFLAPRQTPWYPEPPPPPWLLLDLPSSAA